MQLCMHVSLMMLRTEWKVPYWLKEKGPLRPSSSVSNYNQRCPSTAFDKSFFFLHLFQDVTSELDNRAQSYVFLDIFPYLFPNRRMCILCIYLLIMFNFNIYAYNLNICSYNMHYFFYFIQFFLIKDILFVAVVYNSHFNQLYLYLCLYFFLNYIIKFSLYKICVGLVYIDTSFSEKK